MLPGREKKSEANKIKQKPVKNPTNNGSVHLFQESVCTKHVLLFFTVAHSCICFTITKIIEMMPYH